ncbi:MAG: T9SS type A sorting domain-containing protein [Flavobacteriales bacterium]|nr:T9SS type A sorting domain-containing protein [Flavobacteriales bacterium]
MRYHFLSSLLAIILCTLFTQIRSQSNQYLHFDGVNDYAVTPEAAQYVAGADGVSMTGWFYTDQLVYGQGFLGIRDGGDGDGEMYMIQLSNGVMECRYISSNGFHEFVGPAGTGQAGVWQHIAWIYTGSTIELFVDGVSIGDSPASGIIESLDRPFGIGKSIQSGFNFVFGGRVDEVTLWSRALTPSELADMIENELVGDEEGLELYYKMNQGVPGADNTSITELISETGGGTRNADLVNFAMSGENSNFNGELEDGFQSISFPQIPNKLISDAPFELNASVNSGLPIIYNILSGPATIDGSTLTLNGSSGQVVVRASQPGNDIFDPAADVDVAFDAVDPAEILPTIDLRNPVAGDFYAPDLTPILLASIVDVPYPDLFSISDISYEVDGQSVSHTDYGNKHQTAWWQPDTYGEHTLSITATHSSGTSHTESVTFNIVNSTTDQVFTAFSDVWADSDDFAVEIEGELPSYLGAFNNILGQLDIDCPPGGCDPWDRVSSIEVKAHDGEWYQIIRYLTPYGVACEHEIDLTDFMSLLQGKVRFRVNLGTQGNGFLYTLNLDYTEGSPDYVYSTVEKLWNQTYAFGDMADLQPTEQITSIFPDGAEEAKIKLVSTGHGWGDLNTGNAAEFHQDTHHIWVNGDQTFTQLNWNNCNPNPDGCNPQNGTWYFDRAGWCPGSIAQFFDYSMTDFISSEPVVLDYIFNEDYVDFCHPNNPNCNTGVTCADCNAGFNPHLIVSSYLITLGDEPLDETEIIVGLEDEAETQNDIDFGIWPNPSAGRFEIDLSSMNENGTITIFDELGQLVDRRAFNRFDNRMVVELLHDGSGIYLVQIETAKSLGFKKVVVE